MSITVDVEMMLFEAGIIANAVSCNPAGLALSARIGTEVQAAEDASQASLTFSFSAIESGMAYGALAGLSGAEDDDLMGRLLDKVRAVMQEIGAIPEDAAATPAPEATADETAATDDSSATPAATDGATPTATDDESETTGETSSDATTNTL